MSTKEKKLLSTSLLAFSILFAVYVLIQIVSTKVVGKDFKDYLFTYESQEHLNELEPKDLVFNFRENGIISLKDVTKEDGWILYSLHPVHSGLVAMDVSDADTGELLLTDTYYVSATGIITNFSTRNFTNYRIYQLNLVLLCFGLSIILWFSFAYAQKELRYSYQSIFYSGLALWMTLITILQFRVWWVEDLMIDAYDILQTAPLTFILYTSIPMLLFCIALSVSNISLIRHEGFRTRNALGIILSLVMILGEVLVFVITELFGSGSEMQMKIFNGCTSIFASFYAFMECFLIGAILCGSLSASHEPAYDKDYLIILGCKVKPDGTLYPLIRGRVDRAIAFYKKQLEKTGKKAIFIPSGGQGSDETISEADAMKRYLLEQGIPEEQILVENQSKNTLENMRFSKKLIEERGEGAKAAFSTTNFHVFRSGIIARQNDFEPDGMGSKTKWYVWPNAYMREVIGMMAYKWKAMVLVMLPIIAFFIAIQFV